MKEGGMMPDTIVEQARVTLKKSGKLNYDPAAYAAGYLAGVQAARETVVKALEKYVEKGAK